mmetsp:Transcript_59244/g.98118  ORF Transcript_59244/g.98118 Transcript_59244/m.98118 type:complete len:131 (-) Transcript_59244:477-869(-)
MHDWASSQAGGDAAEEPPLRLDRHCAAAVHVDKDHGHVCYTSSSALLEEREQEQLERVSKCTVVRAQQAAVVFGERLLSDGAAVEDYASRAESRDDQPRCVVLAVQITVREAHQQAAAFNDRLHPARDCS